MPRKDAATLTHESVTMLLLLETLRWDEEEDTHEGGRATATPMSYIPQSVSVEQSLHTHTHMEGLLEEMASLKLMVQQLQQPQRHSWEKEEGKEEEKTEQTSVIETKTEEIIPQPSYIPYE